MLTVKTEPVNESRLIRDLSEIYGYPSTMDASLFDIHFSLFHTLYLIKCSPEYSQFYTHIYTLYLRMIPIPDKGLCSRYFEQKGQFCLKSCQGNLCLFHTSESLTKNIPVNAVMTAFYLDPENIKFQDYFPLDDAMNRILMYGLCKTKVDQAFKLFGLESWEFKKIRSRYYALANIHHPDRSGEQDTMKKINSAYSLLKKIFPAE